MSESNVAQTENKLQEFDVALAIAEKAINYQLKNAWKQWTKQSGEAYPIRVSFPPRAGEDVASLDASLGAPSLKLDGLGGPEVRVSFTITSGKMVFRDANWNLAEENVKGVVFSFVSSLDKAHVSIDELYHLDESSGDQAKKIMGGINAGAFSIECLFLSFTTRDVLRQFKAESSEARREIPELIRTRLENLFTYFVETQGTTRFMLNTAVYPREPSREPTFQLKDYRHHLTRSGTDGGPSNQAVNTVDYMGVFFNGNEMPNNTVWHNVVDGLGPWLFSSQMDGSQSLVAGVMAIRNVLVARHFCNGLAAAIKADYAKMHAENEAAKQRLGKIEHPETELPHPEADLLKDATLNAHGSDGSIELSIEQKNHWAAQGTEDPTVYDLHKTLTMTLTPTAGSGYEITGKLAVVLNRDRKTKFLFISGESHATGASESALTGKVQLRAMGDATRVAIVPQVEISFGTNQNRVSTGSSWYALGGNEKWDAGIASVFSEDSRKAIEKMLKDSIERTNVTLSGFGFIPPGEEVFTFSNPRFTAAKDLMLDVIYKATKAHKAS